MRSELTYEKTGIWVESSTSGRGGIKTCLHSSYSHIADHVTADSTNAYNMWFGAR